MPPEGMEEETEALMVASVGLAVVRAVEVRVVGVRADSMGAAARAVEETGSGASLVVAEVEGRAEEMGAAVVDLEVAG